MNLATAKGYAEKIAEWLRPHCHRIEIAGSIRRERPECGDVDIVCIPKITEQRDLLGDVIGFTNHCFNHIIFERAAGRLTVQSGGELEGRQMIIQLRKCQLDLWFAEKKNIGTRLICRTGSKEHNILLARRALELGGSWNPYEGVTIGGRLLPAETEEQVYTALELPWIEPTKREGEVLAQMIL